VTNLLTTESDYDGHTPNAHTVTDKLRRLLLTSHKYTARIYDIA